MQLGRNQYDDDYLWATLTLSLKCLCSLQDLDKTQSAIANQDLPVYLIVHANVVSAHTCMCNE